MHGMLAWEPVAWEPVAWEHMAWEHMAWEPVSGFEPLTCRLQDGCSAN
jgi:hypothetical protein